MSIEHDTAGHRFVMQLDEGEGELAYVLRGNDVMDIVHTHVPPDGRGEGAGEQLVLAALEHARANDLRIVPSCPFVRHWMSEHPEHAGLLATGG